MGLCVLGMAMVVQTRISCRVQVAVMRMEVTHMDGWINHGTAQGKVEQEESLSR